MDAADFRKRMIRLGEEKITKWVDQVLSRNYLHADRNRAWLRDTIESLDLPSREDTDALKNHLERLERRIENLATRLEALHGG